MFFGGAAGGETSFGNKPKISLPAEMVGLQTIFGDEHQTKYEQANV